VRARRITVHILHVLIAHRRFTLMHRSLSMSILLALTLATSLPEVTLAHSGRLNSQGCHGGSRPYHCHRSSSEMTSSGDGGYRLRCAEGSRSKDCRGGQANAGGSAVRAYQVQLLKHCRGLPEGFADGSYGPATRNALIRFQRAHGLQPDGKYGPRTAQALAGPISGACN
jgi:hypothetical protein